MDSQTLERTARDLTKAASQPSSSSTYLISTLSDLDARVKPTEELLRTTKIGIAVNKLKQHKDPQVASRANELVGKWRRDVKALKDAVLTPKGGTKTKDKADTNTNGLAGKTSLGSPMKAEGKSTTGAEVKYKTLASLEQRNSKTDGVDLRVTGNDVRDSCLKLMYDGLAFMSEEPPSSILAIASAIEAAAYSLHQPSSESAPSAEYRSKIRSLFQNLKSKSNPHLRRSVLSESLKPESLVRLSSEELKSDKRREEDEKMQKENMDKAMVAQEEKSISSSLKCSKCGQKKVTYSQAQTRSADEPMTTFCECSICGNRWKFS